MTNPADMDPAQTIHAFRRAATTGIATFAAGSVALDASNAAWWDAQDTGLLEGLLALAAVVLYVVGALAGYVTLTMWMSRIRILTERLGDPVPAKWRIYAAWFIPIYAWWGPLRTMQRLASRANVTGWIALWWATWLASSVSSVYIGRTTIDASIGTTVSLIKIPVFIAAAIALSVVVSRVTWAVDHATKER